MTRQGRRGRIGLPAADERTCARCGRRMRAGADAEARWCSAACRRQKLGPLDARLESVLRTRLGALSAGSTLCPSEIARLVGGDDWRPLMEPTRRAARRLVAEGAAEITQGGVVVDPSRARGPIRVRPVR